MCDLCDWKKLKTALLYKHTVDKNRGAHPSGAGLCFVSATPDMVPGVFLEGG